MALNISNSLRKDLVLNFYSFQDETDEDNEDELSIHDPKVVQKLYQQQFEKHNQNKSHNNKVEKTMKYSKKLHKSNEYQTSDTDKSIESVLQAKRIKRQATREIITFEWLKNDNSFMSINNSNEFQTRDEHTLFPNGTLKIMSNNHSTDVYQCRVNYIYDNREKKKSEYYKIGPVISTSTKVDFACKFIKAFA